MKVLVVVDMQNDFIDGVLGTKEAVAITERVAKKIESYKADGQIVIFTRDTHDEDYFSTKESKYLPILHCQKGTSGWHIRQGLCTDNDFVMDKSTFGALKLPEVIKELTTGNVLEVIELVGLCTDICVISNAIICKTAFPEKDIIVDSSCCAGATPEGHRNALEAMKQCQIAVY